MAYQLDKFNGEFLVSVDDQTVNTTATDLRFVGRNYSGYGEIENENLLHLLENFANTTPPPRAIAGQMWFDKTTKKLKYFDGTKFKVASGAESSSIAPTLLAVGDFWWDNVNEQIKVWNGTEFILVGPDKSPTYGLTSASPAAIKDSVGTEQQIIKFQVGGDVIAIISKSDFTINPTLNPIDGFSQLKKGINFINSSVTTGITTSDHRFWGTAANADRLGGFTSDDFLKVGSALFSSQVAFGDSGITIGDQNDFRIRVINGSDPIIENTLGKPFIFRISNNGVEIKDIVEISTTAVFPGLDVIYDLGKSSARWKRIYGNEFIGGTFYGTFIGSIQATNNGPLNFNSVGITGDFNQIAADKNHSVILSGGGKISFASGQTGDLNNFNVGNITRGTGAFTTLAANDTVTFTKNAASTSTATGTLIVTGGVGIGGALNVGGESKFLSTGGLGIPTGTTSQRPLNPVQGTIRFNTSLNEWEGWDGGQWRPLGYESDEDYGLVTGSEDVYVDYGTLS